MMNFEVAENQLDDHEARLAALEARFESPPNYDLEDRKCGFDFAGLPECEDVQPTVRDDTPYCVGCGRVVAEEDGMVMNDYRGGIFNRHMKPIPDISGPYCSRECFDLEPSQREYIEKYAPHGYETKKTTRPQTPVKDPHVPLHIRRMDHSCREDCVACRLGYDNTLEAAIEERWCEFFARFPIERKEHLNDGGQFITLLREEFRRHMLELMKEFA